jgi:hypothetical protein
VKEVTVNVFYPTRPHAKQLEVLNAPERFKLLRAGRKFRKTSLMISWLLEGALDTGLPCPYIAPNARQAKNIVWNDHLPRILNHFKERGVPYKTNEVELSVRFPNGGSLQLFGVENKEALRGISNWGRVACDEYDDWAEDIWPLIIRPNLMTHKAPAIIGGTPKGKRGMYRLSQDPTWREFHYTSHDNPDLDAEELDALEREYQSFGEDAYNQEILAMYVKPTGTVYKEWPESHGIALDYDPNLPLHVAWDFGVNDPTAMIWIQPHGGETCVIDYYESSDVDIQHFVQVLNSKPYRTPSLHVGDIAGRARNLVTNSSPIDELAKQGIFVATKSIPDIATQIRTAHKIVPGLYVDKHRASRFIDVLNNYKYPAKSEALLNQSNEVPIHDQFSHGARAFEYWAYNQSEKPATDTHVHVPAKLQKAMRRHGQR